MEPVVFVLPLVSIFQLVCQPCCLYRFMQYDCSAPFFCLYPFYNICDIKFTSMTLLLNLFYFDFLIVTLRVLIFVRTRSCFVLLLSTRAKVWSNCRLMYFE